MIAAHPGALQLRLYQTLVEVSGEASSTIVFPVPIDLQSQQMQSMMQSAVALAASQAPRQLGEASRDDRLPAPGAGADKVTVPRR
jgi:hypothetical protein